MSGCAKNTQTTQVKKVEIHRNQLDELMSDSKKENISIEESLDGIYMCAIDYETNHIVILDKTNTVVLNTKLVSLEEEDLNLSFYAWADEKSWLWLVHHKTYLIKDFVKIDLTTGQTTYFEQNYGFARDFSLEPNTGYLCFSNAPMILDIDEREAFLDANQEVTLKLVNLFNKEEPQIVETATSREFCPEWVEPYTFTYNNPWLSPYEIEKVTYSFNQSYELLPTLTSPPIYETDEQYSKKCQYILEELKSSNKESEKEVTLYGYTIPIKDITLCQNTDEWINEKGYIRCIPHSKEFRLHLFIDDNQPKDNKLLADFFRLKYSEPTVKWLMEKFVNEKNSYIGFNDGSYIRFSMTTAGFKRISIKKIDAQI